MKKRIFLLAWAVSVIGLNAEPASVARPNILWLIAEDLGPHLACYGTKEVWTPNLDRLAGRAGRLS